MLFLLNNLRRRRASSAAPQQPPPSYSDETYRTLSGNGWSELLAEYGAALPDGSNLRVSQVEGDSGGNWAPNQPAGKTVSYEHFAPSGYSGHANAVLDRLVGSSSPINGCTDIYAYRSTIWQFFESGNATGSAPPADDGADIVNMSFVVLVASSAELNLRRADYMVDAYGMLIVAGLDNNPTMPVMWGNFYNGIAVGTSDGDHGPVSSTFDGLARQKPEIVSPESNTSYGTPDVARCGGLLMAKGKLDASDLAKPVVIKSILMTGATKEAGFSWSASGAAQPLDPTYGAGEVNVYNAWKIQEAGKDASGPIGWRYESAPSDHLFYHVGDEFVATLCWNREITTASGWNSPDFTLHNLNLELWSSNANGDKLSKVMESVSALDNLQHLYDADGLAEGYYVLSVTGDTRPYGLSWRN